MNLPATFMELSKPLLGSQWAAFLKALEEEPPVSIRMNPFKPWTDHSTESVPWCSDGYYLPLRPSFTFDPLFHAGCYYVQEASSMFLEQAVKACVDRPVVCLDLCAAPGGKATHLASILPEGSLLVADELISNRAKVLSENLVKWGNPATIVVNNDPRELGALTGMFDLIVADLPCSGEGMFRKDPDSIEEWSPAAVICCAERQKRIIADVWPALKPGGWLIYSTCTYNTIENEENIQWISETFDATVKTVPSEASWGIAGSFDGDLPVYRFLQHRTKGEGFFLALLQKKQESTQTYSSLNTITGNLTKRSKKGLRQKETMLPDELNSILTHPDRFSFFTNETNELLAVPTVHAYSYLRLKDSLKVIHAGVPLGTFKGQDFVVHHALAMSTALRRGYFPELPLNRREAIAFLQKAPYPTFPANRRKGYHLVTFEEHPLGFIKHLGSRINNLYPSEWRIRKSCE
ncbi:MAG: RsmB/NOP family class I SAM-dependent RNA methyltransferase [Dysgonamonadaceae bacterium]|jgi:16S rRNA C967 or C1407 C5-methylase (RsmB/RsmF family)/NOL1/NOP2/fmu family ribosome biogenesis protein|nr:RsmB/NOP family class I SAM-dependent RNA methyltransferase [Dysgonamonadaceae bacterium]